MTEHPLLRLFKRGGSKEKTFQKTFLLLRRSFTETGPKTALPTHNRGPVPNHEWVGVFFPRENTLSGVPSLPLYKKWDLE